MGKLPAITRLLLASFALPAAAQTTGNWTQLLPSTIPPPRQAAGMAYDSARAQIVMFGGSNSQSLLNDTWVWNGTNWAQKLPIPSPNPRSSPAMAYDPVHGQVVLFGGSASNPVGTTSVSLNDTWTWNGTQWSAQSPATSPPALNALPAMAFDAAHGQVILLLGDGFSTETWIWSGSNWTRLSPQTSPPSSFDYTMTYDPVHSQIVAWASSDFSTWVWDGSNWTKKPSQSSPHASLIAQMAADPLQSQVILFSDLGQTWTWDGSTWTEDSPQTPPPPRSYFSLAFDSASNQLLLFGGVLPSGDVSNDSFTWQGGPTLPVIANIVSASGFGGFKAVAPGSWVEIYGTNLAPDTRTWTTSDFNGNNAPTVLDNVQVMIGGQKAFIDFISAGPGQVNVQLPSNIISGSQLTVTLSNANGTSQPFSILVNPAEPGLLAPSSFTIGGTAYVVALLPDNVTYVLPTGAIRGVTSRPAHSGETITLYGIGFGPVTPNIPAGQIVRDVNNLAGSLQVFFGQTQAQVSFAGLTQGSVGLYQINVVVPNILANNLVPLSFTLNGVGGTQTLYTAVQ
jgi:uncharacterized protein (TIGR03437 family)